MKAQIYQMKIEYKGAEELLWRTIEISSNAYLSKLAYTILASFDTLANHMFSIQVGKDSYEIDFDDDCEETTDPRCVRLSDLNLEINDSFNMIYDFGCDHTFVITLKAINTMERGTSIQYPKIVDGVGKGILEDVFIVDYIKIAKKNIERKKATHRYVDMRGESIWDYYDFTVPKTNNALKDRILTIQMGYEG